jgi:hypothetical protein
VLLPLSDDGQIQATRSRVAGDSENTLTLIFNRKKNEAVKPARVEAVRLNSLYF